MVASRAQTYPVVVQEWEESEAGWGVRPDGATLHLTEASRASYVSDYWEREKKNNPSGAVPHEYTRTSGRPQVIDVDKATYDKVKGTKNGLMLWESEYRTLRKAQQ